MRSRPRRALTDLEDDTPMICGRLSASYGAIQHVHVSHVRTVKDSVRVVSRASSFINSTRERRGPTQDVASVSDLPQPSTAACWMRWRRICTVHRQVSSRKKPGQTTVQDDTPCWQARQSPWRADGEDDSASDVALQCKTREGVA